MRCVHVLATDASATTWPERKRTAEDRLGPFSRTRPMAGWINISVTPGHNDTQISIHPSYLFLLGNFFLKRPPHSIAKDDIGPERN